MLAKLYQSHALLKSQGPELLTHSVRFKTLDDGLVDQNQPRFLPEKQIICFLTPWQTILLLIQLFITG